MSNHRGLGFRAQGEIRIPAKELAINVGGKKV